MGETDTSSAPAKTSLEAASDRLAELWLGALGRQSPINSAVELLNFSSELKGTFLRKHMAPDSPLRDLVAESQLLTQDSANDFRALFETEFRRLAHHFAVQSAVNIETIVSAACIILGHSLADDVLNGCIELAFEIAPADWAADLDSDTRVALREVAKKSYDELILEALQHHKANLTKKSLPNRADIFFRHVPIVLHTEIPKTAVEYFRLSRLKEIDQVRHALVHADGLKAVKASQAKEFVPFLQEAVFTFLRSVGFKYGLSLNLQKALRATGLRGNTLTSYIDTGNVAKKK